MRLLSTVVLAGLLIIGCTDRPSSSLVESQNGVELPAATSTATSAMQAGASHVSTTPAIGPALAGRTGELVNPNDDTMVFLYYGLAGVRPPLEQWVEEDARVMRAPAFDKASLRSAVKAELESAATGVRSIGFIRLSMNANLSDYDPTYGEFSVRALAPSSTLEFSALRHKVSLRFSNGRVAQIWRVPAAEAQVIRDKIGPYGRVSLDALLRIVSVQPSSAGGTITTEIIEYEMRESQRGLTIGRVQVVQ